jgi:hypothetical protein
MDRMGKGRVMFEGVECDEEIHNLDDPHIPFNATPERERDERSARDRFRDEYVMTPFSQSTQAWRMRAAEEQRRYADNFEIDAVEKDHTQCVGGDLNDLIDLCADILEKPGDVDVDVEETSIDIEIVKVAGESSKIMSIRKKRRGLSPHRLPLKERMKDRTISYFDLLRPNPLPKMEPRRKPGASTRLG